MEPAGRPTRKPRASLVVTPLAFVVVTLMVAGGEGPLSVIVPFLIIMLAGGVTVWAFLWTQRQRRLYEDRLTAWAGQQAAQAERLRIARDLHDIVSHGLGLITVRAASTTGLPVPDGDAERRNALADIERVARGTTTELRRMLSVLRAPEDRAPLLPADTLDALPAILDDARATGLQTVLDLGDIGDPSPGVQLTLCAIIREALTNTARHAGPTRAFVTVYRDGDAIVTDVGDDGPVPGWRPHPGAGHGLDGLRERVTALGGTLKAEPDGHRFRLVARIPDREQA